MLCQPRRGSRQSSRAGPCRGAGPRSPLLLQGRKRRSGQTDLARSDRRRRPAPGRRRPATARATCPASSAMRDLYDRIAHNLFSINMVWVLIAGFLVMFMQAGFAMVETGLVPGEERGPHDRHELHDLPAGLHRLLGLWIRASAGATGSTARSRRAGISTLGPGHVGAQQRPGDRRRRGRPPARSPTACWAPRASSSTAWTTSA